MFLFRVFDMYMVKVLGGHPKKNADDLNIILHSAFHNKLWVTYAASMSA
jgi:hypothetical protein